MKTMTYAEAQMIVLHTQGRLDELDDTFKRLGLQTPGRLKVRRLTEDWDRWVAGRQTEVEAEALRSGRRQAALDAHEREAAAKRERMARQRRVPFWQRARMARLENA